MNEYITRIADNALEVSQILRQASTKKKNAVLTELARLLNENRANLKAENARDIAYARLAKTRQPIARIAAELGYADPSTFYRAFVAWSGMSPEQFRHRLAGNDGLPAASAGPDRRPAPTPRVTAGRQRSREFGPTEA